MKILLTVATTLSVFALEFEATADKNCIPGAQVSCACPGGAQGVQVCRDDGGGYATCACAGAPSSTSQSAAPQPQQSQPAYPAPVAPYQNSPYAYPPSPPYGYEQPRPWHYAHPHLRATGIALVIVGGVFELLGSGLFAGGWTSSCNGRGLDAGEPCKSVWESGIAFMVLGTLGWGAGIGLWAGGSGRVMDGPPPRTATVTPTLSFSSDSGTGGVRVSF